MCRGMRRHITRSHQKKKKNSTVKFQLHAAAKITHLIKQDYGKHH